MDVFTPAKIISVLRARGLALKKSLGQNFLVNRDVAERIVRYAHLDESDVVLEVGPGLGGMTRIIARKARTVIAVELDGGLVRYLQEEVSGGRLGNVTVINGDFLKLDVGDIVRCGEPGKVISNFPYGIGIRALLRIVGELPSVGTIVGTLQKELVDRITASPGSRDYAAVSVRLQEAALIRVREKRISPGSFFPRPAVDSAIVSLHVRPEGERSIPRRDLPAFNELVRSCFANRRKSLLNNLAVEPVAVQAEVSRKELRELVTDLFGDPSLRAEAMSVADFERLFTSLRHRSRDAGS
jgi:16S rRNA (adenine1518-N6/adenine1519-N6)-dimethyltransferase